MATSILKDDNYWGGISRTSKEQSNFLLYGSKQNCARCGAIALIQASSQPQYVIKHTDDIQKVDVSPQQLLANISKHDMPLTRTNIPNQIDRSMAAVRAKSVEMIILLGEYLRQSQLTIFLGVNYLDRALISMADEKHHEIKVTKGEVSESRLRDILSVEFSIEAISVTCLLLASKFDELDDNIPMI